MNKKQHTSKGLPQATQMEIASDINQSLISDNARFEAFDPELGMEYSLKIAAKISEINAMPPDYMVRSQQMRATKKVVDISNSALGNIRTVKYYVEKAFPDDYLIMHEFGYNYLIKAQSSQIRLIQHLKGFVLALNLHKSELTAKGLSQTLIDEVIKQSIDLEIANIEQEQAKKARFKATGLRIKAYNELWELVGNVAKAGKIIFEDEPDTQRDYILDRTPKKKTVKIAGNEVNVAMFQGNITDAETNAVIEDVIVEIVGTDFNSTTDEDGDFYMDDVVPGTYTVKITAFGYKELLKTGIELVSDNEDQEFDFVMEKLI